jgi:UDP-N-acetylglucosamine acyltransferase
MTKVHPTAIVDDSVELGEGVEIGPFCVLTGKVRLGEGVRLISSVSIQGPVEIGKNTTVYPTASIGFEPQDYKFKPGSPTAGVVIGSDTIIREYVTIHAASNVEKPTRIGSRVMMMIGAHAGHDVTVGDDVVMVNTSHLAGHSTVEDRALVSGAVMLHQFGRIGYMAMCSGGSILTGDLPPFCTSAGRNAVVGLNLVGMRRSGMPAEEINAVRYAYKTVLRKNPPLPVMKEMLLELGQHSPAVKRMADFIIEAKRPIVPVGGRRVS